jgi:peptidoglycan/xylan/chitin deacetylase (PgdA/CDA1 family)
VRSVQLDDPRFARRRMLATVLLVAGVAVGAILLAAIASPAKHRPRASHVAPRPHVAPLSPPQRAALVRRAQQLAVAHVRSYTPLIAEGGSAGHEVALTFDDGPGPYTAKLVTVLNKLGVHGTFFAIGENERYFEAGTLAELRSGDVVGDHTETHPMMATLSKHDQREEIFEQALRVELLGAPRPQLFRPPYRSFDATTFRELRKLHMLMVLWSIDTADYTQPGVHAIVQRALAGVHAGSIILLHDGGGNRSQTIAALPGIVRGLRKRGLQPVTVTRLLLDDPPPRGQPIPTNLTGD